MLCHNVLYCLPNCQCTQCLPYVPYVCGMFTVFANCSYYLPNVPIFCPMLFVVKSQIFLYVFPPGWSGAENRVYGASWSAQTAHEPVSTSSAKQKTGAKSLRWWLLSVRFKYKPDYKPCDQLLIQFLSWVEITASRLESKSCKGFF